MGGLWIDNEEITTDARYAVMDKYRQHVLEMQAEADAQAVATAVASAQRAWRSPLTVDERYRILSRAAARLEAERESWARTICREAGKPLRDARAEVDRAVQTLVYSAIAAKTLRGEEVPVRGTPGGERRVAVTLRKPYGVVAAITPFNFPLNLVAHKVGPALAAGNAVVLKPAPATPLTALALARCLKEAGLPPGWLNVVTGQDAAVGERLVAHPEVALISFTGSAAVGEQIRRQAGLRPVLLELGNNSANIVHSDADLDQAATVLAQRAFGYAGQACIAVQRIYVHRPVWDAFLERLARATRSLAVGDPESEATVVGPMISEAAAERALAWYQEAVAQGALPVVKPERQGTVLTPGLLANPAPHTRLVQDEVFAPLAGVMPYDDFEEALDRVNASRYGLQAGVFTQDLRLAWRAAEALAVGGVIINDSSAYRADNMPYGGIKASGLGREGPEYAVREMTYPTVVVFSR